jgi:hypothetical protein
MAKLIRKEKNIYYEYFEVEITDEQLELFKNDREKFDEDYIFNDALDFELNVQQYIDTTDMDYYVDGVEQEPI